MQRLIKQLECVLSQGAKALYELRLKRKVWRDDFVSRSDSPTGRTFMQTCEGLDGMLIAILESRNKALLEKLFRKPMVDEIEKDLEYLLNIVEQGDYKFFPGDPYYTRGGPRHKTPYNCSDALAFFTSVMTHLLGGTNLTNLTIGQYEAENIAGRIMKCINTIIETQLEGGSWPFYLSKEASVEPDEEGDEGKATEIPDEYSTWSVLETIAEVRNYYPEGYRKLDSTGVIKKARSYLAALMENGKIKHCQKFLDSITHDTDFSSPQTQARARCFYEAVHALAGLAILQYPAPRRFSKFTAEIINQKEFILKKEFATFYPNGGDDYTLAPMLLRCLAGAFTFYLREEQAEVFEEGLGFIKDHRDSILLDIYSYIIKQKRHYNKAGKYDGFFCDRSQDGATDQESMKIDIYYTERVIESLASYHEYLTAPRLKRASCDFSPPKLLKSEPKVARTRKKQKDDLPFETRLPSLNAFTSKLRDQYGSPLKEYVVICLQHFLNDFPVFIEKLQILGLQKNNLYIVRKTYGYPEGGQVKKQLSKLGAYIYEHPITLEGQIKQRKEVLAKALSRAKSKDARILIIEDGGYFVPLFHEQPFLKDISVCIGAVEQTTRGIKNDKTIPEIKLPVIDVARSRLKQSLEIPEVGETLAESLRYVCGSKEVHYLPTETPILVIGCGSVGLEVATRLSRMGFLVSAYDNSKTRRNKIRDVIKENKLSIDLLSTISDVKKFKIIFGLSGGRTIDREIIMACQHNTILASGSSERYEIDLAAIEEMTKKPKDANLVRSKDIPLCTYHLETDRSIRVLCDAEPINFALSGGIIKPAIEPVLMQLLWGSVQLVAEKYKDRVGFVRFPKKAEDDIMYYHKRIQR